jgi:hypothetical protein
MADIKRMRRAMEATMNAVERLTRIIAEQDRGLRLLIEELKTTLENTAAEKRLARLDQFVKQHYLNPKSLKHDLIVWFVDGRWTTYNLGTANKKAFVTEFCVSAARGAPPGPHMWRACPGMPGPGHAICNM